MSLFIFTYRALTVSGRLSRTVLLMVGNQLCSPNPGHARMAVWALFPFARRYSGHKNVFFLFLRLLRCFSSPGSPRMPMDSVCVHEVFSMWFPHSEICGHGIFAPCRAYRSLSPSFIGSQCQGNPTLRSCSLNLFGSCGVGRLLHTLSVVCQYGRNLSVPKCCIYIAL